jgi:hypothetical protein
VYRIWHLCSIDDYRVFIIQIEPWLQITLKPALWALPISCLVHLLVQYFLPSLLSPGLFLHIKYNDPEARSAYKALDRAPTENIIRYLNARERSNSIQDGVVQ